MVREPELTLVPGGGVGKRIFVDGGALWSLSPHSKSGRWDFRLPAGGGREWRRN